MNFLTTSKYEHLVKIWIKSLILLIVLIIVIGGLTRLTGSGLSITEWQLFTGIIPPLNDKEWDMYFSLYKNIPQFKLINYDITLSEFKIIFLWEYFHRLLGRVIGLFYLIPLIFFTYKKTFTKKSFFIFVFLFFLICLQGFIGWYMVKSGLINDVTVSHYRLSIHLLTAFLILSILIWIYLNFENKEKFFFNLSIKYISIKLFIFLIFFQIMMGAFVSGLDAGKIYQTWPLMNEFLVPDDINFNRIENLINFNNESLVQFYHRNIAYLIFLIYIYIGFKIYNNKNKILYKPYLILLCIVFLQITLGVLTLISGLNIYLASLHQISSIFLVMFSLNLYHQSLTYN